MPYRPRQRYGISTRAQPGVGIQRLISIRAPLAGSDLAQSLFRTRRTYFNPRSPFGERPEFTALPTRVDIFQSALPLRGATSVDADQSPDVMRFQSALPLRGATSLPRSHRSKRIFQSALPLRGATRRTPTSTPWCSYFNPRSPCGERRKRRSWLRCIPYFNPRSPCGERPFLPEVPQGHREISIRAPLAGSDVRVGLYPPCQFISIRAPLAGSDEVFSAFGISYIEFQSALPLRGATHSPSPPLIPAAFQSALPLRGATPTSASWACRTPDFNPRSPCGERRSVAISESGRVEFQSALPLRGATVDGDSCGAHRNFNPRSPCGERRKMYVFYNSPE